MLFYKKILPFKPSKSAFTQSYPNTIITTLKSLIIKDNFGHIIKF